MPRKTIHPSTRELERWQRAAELAGVPLSELITAATATRVEQIERDHAADLELDQHVRAAVAAAIVERSSVTCGCEPCRASEISRVSRVQNAGLKRLKPHD